MRRLGLVVGVPIVIAALISVYQSVGASTGSVGASTLATRPSPPTSAQATSVAGAPGVSVSWKAPVSDGGSPILYFVASTYGGKHWCTSPNPGADACTIAGIRNGSIQHAIRVRAVTTSGPGQAAAIFSVVTTAHPPTGGPPPSVAAGTSPAASSQLTSSSGSDTTGTAGASDASATSGTGLPAQLPFTGVNVATLFLLGLSLVLIGLNLVRPARRRRQVLDQRVALGPIAAFGARLSGLSRWLLGL